MENAVTYRVRIFTPNCFLIFRGKKIRTPTECHNVFETELDVLKMQILKDSLKYQIVREEDAKKDFKPTLLEKRSIEVKVEELYDPNLDSDSIMDKLISEEKANKK